MKSINNNLLHRSIFLSLAYGIIFFTPTTSMAEQYASGVNTIISAQGQMNINTGNVSHFNANDFFVYSFMFQPKGTKEWHQVPRVESEADTKMLFTIQTKHTPEMNLIDAKVVSIKQKIYLVMGNKETIDTQADDGPVTLTSYELVKLDDYERWVFLRKNTQKTAQKISVDKALENAVKTLSK